MKTSDEINNDLIVLLDECIANGERGYVSLGAWFDATRVQIKDTLADIRSTESEAMHIIETIDAGLEVERIQIHAGIMARDEICPSGDTPKTTYEIGMVKVMSAFASKVLRKWVNKHDH